MSSFFFVSTEITGQPFPRNRFVNPLMYSNWALRSGCCWPSSTAVLGITVLSLLSGLITGVFEKTKHLQCFAARLFGVDLKSRPQVSCRIGERLSIRDRRISEGQARLLSAIRVHPV